MTIELHCPICQKLIKAPDDAGGKRGKCPYCKNLIYLPSVSAEDEEEVSLAPLDETDAEREAQLKAEAAAYSADLSRHTGKDAEGPASAAEAAPAPPGEVTDLEGLVERYVLAMRDSELDTAEEIIRKLRRVRHRTRDYVQGRVVDEMAPPIGDVPEPLVKGFLKSLLDRMK